MSEYLEAPEQSPTPSTYDGPAEPELWAPEEEEGASKTPVWLRYLAALRRFKYLILAFVLLGVGGAAVAYRMVEPEYVAQGSIWVANEGRIGQEQGPITQGDLLQSYAWIDLLRSYTVLDPVVVSEQLYVHHSPEAAPVFEGLSLNERFRPGEYELRVSEDGNRLTLTTMGGVTIQSVEPGDSLGAEVGFRWVPHGVEAGQSVAFTVVTPRDAARELADRLETQMDQLGSFIRLELRGRDPEQITSVLDALMERYVEVARDLKRGKLDEVTNILEEQLTRVENDLREAERQLESFRVTTITLPSEEAAPIAPGLAQTQGPVMADFFQRRIELEELRRDIARLESALQGDGEDGSAVRIQALQMIPAVQSSAQMQSLLQEITTLRAELRTLRQQYTDDFQPVEDLRQQLDTLRNRSVPAVANEIMAELRQEERGLAQLVEERADELEEIPPRSIEEARLERRRQIASDLYIELQQRYETARLAAASSTADVTILDRPVPPQVPVDDERLRWVAMILLGATGAGIAGAVLLDRFDPRLRYPTDIADDLGLEILGVIPRMKEGEDGSAEHFREAFRELRLHVEYAYGSGSPLILAVTSPGQGEGKTTISANLALSFAGLGRKTLLVDGDTRKGDLHTLMNCSRKPGLVDFLRDGEDQGLIQRTEERNLVFMGFGSRSTSSPDMLNSSRMQAMLSAIKRHYEVVVIDCPPLGAGSDAFVLGTHAGNVLVVLRAGATNRDLAAVKLDAFLRLPVRILGGVLNDVGRSGGYGGYGAYRYYGTYLPGYEAGTEEGETEEEEEIAVLPAE